MLKIVNMGEQNVISGKVSVDHGAGTNSNIYYVRVVRV